MNIQHTKAHDMECCVKGNLVFPLQFSGKWKEDLWSQPNHFQNNSIFKFDLKSEMTTPSPNKTKQTKNGNPIFSLKRPGHRLKKITTNFENSLESNPHHQVYFNSSSHSLTYNAIPFYLHNKWDISGPESSPSGPSALIGCRS